MPHGNYFAALPVRVPGGFSDALKTNAPEALRWFHPGDLHLTLAFFGREDPGRIEPILDLLHALRSGSREPKRSEDSQRQTSDQFPAVAPLSSLKLLPNPRRFSAISFELADSPARDAICDLIATWRPRLCAAAGVDPDSRPPYPHLTIARPDKKHPHFRPRLIARWARSVEPPADPIEVLPPALYTWHPDRPKRQFRQM